MTAKTKKRRKDTGGSSKTTVLNILRMIHWPLEELLEILQHTVVLVAAIASIGAVHLALTSILGPDAKFYDRIPIQYVIDTAHLAMLVRFTWKLTQQIWSGDD